MDFVIKSYHEMQPLEFGRYDGMPIFKIAAENPAYLEWCILNLGHFHLITRDCLLMKLELSEQAKQILQEKQKKLDEQIASEHNLTCADGYGQHDFSEKGICLLCRYDMYEPKHDERDVDSTHDKQGDEIDR